MLHELRPGDSQLLFCMFTKRTGPVTSDEW